MRNIIYEPFDRLVEVYWSNSKCGVRVMDARSGSIPIPCRYDSYLILSGYSIALQKDGKWGILNHKNEMICDFIYDRIEKSPEKASLCMAMKNGRWGLINSSSGSEAIGFEFDRIKPFSFLSKARRHLPNEDYDSYDRRYREDFWALFSGGKVIPCDGNAIMIYPRGFDNIYGLVQFGPSSADVGFIIEKDEKLGLLCINGQIVCHCDYDEIKQIEGYTPYHDTFFCLSAVRKGQKWGLLDSKGKESLKCEFDDIKSVGSSLALKHNGKWGIMPLKEVRKIY